MPKKKSTKKYKLKTYKAAAKRFRVTATGKLLRTKGGKSHLRRRKSPRSKAQLSEMQPVTARNEKKRVRRLLPYIKKFRANPPA